MLYKINKKVYKITTKKFCYFKINPELRGVFII